MFKKIKEMMMKEKESHLEDLSQANGNATEQVLSDDAIQENEAQNIDNENITANENSSNNSKEQELTTQLVELQDKYLRLVAEFDNYRKRVNKERLELTKTAGQEVLSALLPVLDDFDRAKNNAAENFTEGITLIHNKLANTLKNKGLEAIDNLIGSEFDVAFHEAITEIPAPSQDQVGKIIDVVEKGYKLGDKIIRYAKVVVGK